MDMTKDAMKLFMKSLPLGSSFQIVSFGSKFEVMNGFENTFVYDQGTLEKALLYIEQMTADMGGTNILEPLNYAMDSLAIGPRETRIFPLTDGQVENRDAVVEKASSSTENVRIHTFGIGDGCDAEMVKNMAFRGSCSLVKDVEDLNGLVVTALA